MLGGGTYLFRQPFPVNTINGSRRNKRASVLSILDESGSKNTAKQQHWGDVRARLELAIEVVLEKALALKAVRLQHYHSLELPKNRQGGEDARVSVVADERQPGDGQTSSSSFECCNADYRDVSLSCKRPKGRSDDFVPIFY